VNSLVSLNPQFLSIEDLNIKDMLKNKYLSKAIKDSMFYYFRIFLTHQCNKNNIELRIIDRWYPSSKTCSKCGNIKRDLKLSDRVYNCYKCSTLIDRDLNASINIKNCVEYNTVG
jgi:putative transposase